MNTPLLVSFFSSKYHVNQFLFTKMTLKCSVTNTIIIKRNGSFHATY